MIFKFLWASPDHRTASPPALAWLLGHRIFLGTFACRLDLYRQPQDRPLSSVDAELGRLVRATTAAQGRYIALGLVIMGKDTLTLEGATTADRIALIAAEAACTAADKALTDYRDATATPMRSGHER
jgi:hypothetical protein